MRETQYSPLLYENNIKNETRRGLLDHQGEYEAESEAELCRRLIHQNVIQIIMCCKNYNLHIEYNFKPGAALYTEQEFSEDLHSILLGPPSVDHRKATGPLSLCE